jgi:hypothetical protein
MLSAEPEYTPLTIVPSGIDARYRTLKAFDMAASTSEIASPLALTWRAETTPPISTVA